MRKLLGGLALWKRKLQGLSKIIGVIYFLSRCARLLANIFFVRIYNSFSLKTGILLAGIMSVVLGAMLVGVRVANLPTKVLAMG